MSDEPKDVEFYAANLNAWFNTRFELDKSLLTLSAGAIGLLITLISTVGAKSIESLILYFLSLVCFILCLGALLLIFRGNAKHLEEVVNNQATNDPFLKILDRAAALSFMLGVIFASIIGISTAINTYIEKEHVMSDKKNIPGTPAFDSVNGIANIRPSRNEKMSVEGITNMRPSAPEPKPQPTTNESKEQSKK